MYSPYQLTPDIKDERKPRDLITFPRALPSNHQLPIHELNFVDRKFVNDRNYKKMPVQNEYLQKYQLHNLQQNYNANVEFEQAKIDRIMNKKFENNDVGLLRNNDDAFLLTHMGSNFLDRPIDTRKEKNQLNNDREPMRRVLGSMPDNYS